MNFRVDGSSHVLRSAKVHQIVRSENSSPCLSIFFKEGNETEPVNGIPLPDTPIRPYEIAWSASPACRSSTPRHLS